MTNPPPSYRGYRFPPDIISHAVWLYHRFGLSFRDVEDLLAERGLTGTYEAIRQGCRTFGLDYARRLRRRRGDTWYLDEVFVKIQGRRHYLWPAAPESRPRRRCTRQSWPAGCGGADTFAAGATAPAAPFSGPPGSVQTGSDRSSRATRAWWDRQDTPAAATRRSAVATTPARAGWRRCLGGRRVWPSDSASGVVPVPTRSGRHRRRDTGAGRRVAGPRDSPSTACVPCRD